MMFTSMQAERRHKDPKPYFIAETNERVDASSFGTPGATIIFSPRPEFTRPAVLPVNVFLDWARDEWTSDSWASVNTTLPAITEWVETISGEVPTSWPFNITGDGYLISDLINEVPEEMLLPMLLHAGEVLSRLAGLIVAAGKDYSI